MIMYSVGQAVAGWSRMEEKGRSIAGYEITGLNLFFHALCTDKEL